MINAHKKISAIQESEINCLLKNSFQELFIQSTGGLYGTWIR